VLSHFRELSHFLVVTVNSAILSVVLSHFAKVFSHLSLLSHFPPLEILSAIFPLLSNFLPLEILSAIFHYLAILRASRRRLSRGEARAGGGSWLDRYRVRPSRVGPSSVGGTHGWHAWGGAGSINLSVSWVQVMDHWIHHPR
jgi:hypothetical protein